MDSVHQPIVRSPTPNGRNVPPIACCAFFLVIAFSISFSFAQDWSITTADFQTHPAVFRSISTTGVHIQMPGMAEGTTLPLDHFVSIQRLQTAAPRQAAFALLQRGGDLLTGEPVKVIDEKLVWRSPTLGELPITLARLVSMTRNRNITPSTESPKQDIVTLANGDTVAGVFVDCSAHTVQVRTDNGISDIPIDTITQITFAATASASVNANQGFRIKLTDGSAITATDVSATESDLTISLDESPPRRVQLPLTQIQSIEQLNGPISWLSSRPSIENVQIPYFSGSLSWPARMDNAVDGSPLQFDGKIFDRGIGVHAYSRISYAIDPGWQSFRTQYAIESSQDIERPLADLTVRIKLDGKIAHEQTHVRAGILSPVVRIDLTGAKTLTLEADYGNAGDTQNHLNWIEPALLRVGIDQAAH